MRQVTIFFVSLLLLCVLSCGKRTEEHLTEVKNGPYKVYVRSQEFDNSGIRNVDICVADFTSSRFPADTRQCFLHGFDFSGLAVGWSAQDNVEISFSCGRVTEFSNFAFISKNHPTPVEFHATLNDKCGATPSREKQGEPETGRPVINR
jgi:hypothetical protein